jgi:hypothetical protein
VRGSAFPGAGRARRADPVEVVTLNGVRTIQNTEDWIFLILFWFTIALKAWAFVDCLARKRAAFTAAGKLTKPAWALLTAFSLGISFLVQDALNLVSWILLIVSLVYLADVRPAVREVSGGSRW